MAQKFTVPITVKQLTSTGSDAVTIFVDADTYARLKIEAGGRLTWGPGNGAGDVNLYRDAADVLRTDDTFKTPTLFVDNIEIDTTGASSGDVLTFDGSKFIASSASTQVIADLDDLGDVVISSPEKYQTLVYDGVGWINEFPTTVSLVNNAEATTLQIGEAVYLYGNTGNHASVKRADNDSDSTSAKTVGLVAAAIPAGGNGPVVTRGYVTGMNLSSGYTAGQTLYLGENGGFTTTKPYAPEHIVYLGVVVRATNNGIIYVAAQNGYELDEIHDVDLITNPPVAGDVLTYNGSLWVSASVSGGGGASVTVSTTAPASPSEGDMWFESDTGRTYVYYDSYWVEVGAVSAGSRLVVGSNPPNNPTVGDMWFDSDTTKTYVYYDSTWVEIGGAGGGGGSSVTVSASAPASPSQGDLWFDSDTAQTFIYYDSQWIEIGASAMAATVSSSAPNSPIDGQVWFDSDTGGTYVYYSGNWVEVGAAPQITSSNVTTALGYTPANSTTAATTGKAIAMAIVFGS